MYCCSLDIITVEPAGAAYVFLGRTLVVTCTVPSIDYVIGTYHSGYNINIYIEPGNVSHGVQLVWKIKRAPEYINGTVMHCSTVQTGLTESGFSSYCVTKDTYIYVQGMPIQPHHNVLLSCTGPPEPVDHLVAVQQDQCSVLIEWDPPPYLLPGLGVVYYVIINNKIVREGLHSTNFTYNPTSTGTYSVILIAYNDTLIGKQVGILYEHKGINTIHLLIKLLVLFHCQDLQLNVAYDSADTVVQGSSMYLYKFTIKVNFHLMHYSVTLLNIEQ